MLDGFAGLLPKTDQTYEEIQAMNAL